MSLDIMLKEGRFQQRSGSATTRPTSPPPCSMSLVSSLTQSTCSELSLKMTLDRANLVLLLNLWSAKIHLVSYVSVTLEYKEGNNLLAILPLLSDC